MGTRFATYACMRLAPLIGLLAFAGLPIATASAEPRPNVLLIVTDDQRAEGTMQVMPDTRRIFGRGGTEFRNAVATTPSCCPSRATIMSGRYAHNHGVWHNRNNQEELDQLDKDSLLAHMLSRTGYRTGIVGKYLNSWSNAVPPPDFDRFAISQGPFFNTTWNIDGRQRLVTQYSTGFVAAQARRLVRAWERRDRKPWFLYVAPFAPHGTLGPGGPRLEPQPRYANAPVGAFTSNPAREETTGLDLVDKPPFWRRIVADYRPPPGLPNAAAVRAGQLRMLLSVDDLVRGLFRKLRRAGERRRTLAVFVSDNGLFWGEHGGPPVKDMPYREAVDVPLYLRWPGHFRRGRIDNRTAATVDLAPTIVDAARVRSAPPMDGRSLLGRWQRKQVLLEYQQAGPFPTWASLHRPGSSQFTEYYAAGGAVRFREYYDLEDDPFQLRNMLMPPLPGAPAVPPLSAKLAAARACAGANCP